MWLFTRYGFFSAVCARDPDAPGGFDPARIAVRARRRAHLEALRERFPAELGAAPIREDGRTDYPFRLFVGKAEWAEALAALARETDYHNFKDTVHEREGASRYERALHDVWRVMLGLEGAGA